LEETAIWDAHTLLKASEFLRERIQNEWLWGRNWEMVMKVARGKPKPRIKRIRIRRSNPPLYPDAIQGLMKMLNRINVFLSYGDDPRSPFSQSLQVLCTEVEAIVRDRRFRNCFWYR